MKISNYWLLFSSGIVVYPNSVAQFAVERRE